jgi:predicted DNA-binding WGR domain protein
MKIILEAKSQGQRGDNGYKKRYIIEQFGDNKSVRIRWGKAETITNRNEKYFTSEFLAQLFIDDQVDKKLKKGYEIVSD